MRRGTVVSLVSIIALMGMGSCLDPYQAPTGRYDIRNLVVDGFLNATDGVCTVKLTRIQLLEDFEAAPAESSASVSIIDGNGTTYGLTEVESGVYTANSLTLGQGDQVRLMIKTADQLEYESALIPVLITTPIDSISYESKRDGLAVYVTTHNDNTNKHYNWKFKETWYHPAKFETAWTLDDTKRPVRLEENIFECWTTASSTEILVGASSQRTVTEGVIRDFPLTTVPWSSTKLQTRYSMEVLQTSITPETFEYQTQLKKNTENLGTLFDALPSSPQGNIRCISNPDVPVEGNFTASTIARKRLFVSTALLDWPEGVIARTGSEDCILSEIRMASDWQFFWPVANSNSNPKIGTTESCVDCRLNGGTNVQPDFWQ